MGGAETRRARVFERLTAELVGGSGPIVEIKAIDTASLYVLVIGPLGDLGMGS
jgi:hypothetical protein